MRQNSGLSVPLFAAAACFAALALALSPAAAQGTVTPASSAPPPGVSAPPAAAPKPTAKRVSVDQIERRIADLHRRLKITPAQETQWGTVAQIMRDNAKTVDGLGRERLGRQKTMSAVEDLQSYEQIIRAHDEGLQQLLPAFQTLYDSMSDEQKKNADVVFRGPERRRAPPAKKG